ncbi:hypothetical protein GRI97_04195 [Altererythrobacter xixiisoli]|uniref:Uncharacterized protein n=1 Tax=Croceibacterium xixiisoli TaxID=1476466 RepID=A0A6I4TQN3_9SPHN|nr:hypothetical protein [Croceibacterium xixiisoli]MXO98186.1 hypothetical protein [Croceibacterium xixiisoli]
MALDQLDLKLPNAAGDHASPPAGRWGGALMQRLQVGLFGLAAMVLLVGLANIIMNSAQENQARVVPEAAPTIAVSPSSTPASDPLADAGVVPDFPGERASTAASAEPADANPPVAIP